MPRTDAKQRTLPLADRITAPEEGPFRSLTAAEVAERVARGLVNRAPQAPWADYRAILWRNVFTLFNGLVVPAAVALFLLGEWRGAVAVSGLALLNSAIGLAQELRAKWHLDRLALLAEPRAHVIRDGCPQEIPAGDIVQDDQLLLTAGEPVLADGVVLAARHLEVDEALLTGESDPVPAPPGRPLLSGSFCVAGTGVYLAEKVGAAAYAQRTGLEARRYRFSASPLQHTINRLIEILTVTAIVMCLLYVGLFFLRGFPAAELVRMVAATITSMVPQGLVLFTTLAFILGAVRLSARGAVVQQLSAVESMAAVNVVCLDKTGTLTTNRLRLDRVRVVDPAASEEEVRRLLTLFADASPGASNKTIQALRAGVGEHHAAGEVEILDSLPFKSQNRYSAVWLRPAGGTRGGGAETHEAAAPSSFVLVLGACEALQPFFPAAVGDHWEKAWRELLPTGLRLLMFARADVPPGASSPPFEGQLPPLELRPLALIALGDELRPDAAEVLAALAAQGLRFKIISGDHPETVHAVITQLRLPVSRTDVVTGAELTAASEPGRLIAARTIFARVAPRQKVEIIEALQRQGDRVAMIGDGINDLLAIKRADLGIAMGDGSAATRTVAGLVLENNRFELLPATLTEGRNILRNLRRAAKIFLLKNVYTLLLIVAALGVLGLPFPYLPQQVTLLNKLTIGIPVFVITVSRTSAARAGHAGFLRQVGWFAVTTGLVVGLAGLAVFLLAAHVLGDPVPEQRTMLLSTLILLGLANLPRVLTTEGERLTFTDRQFLWWIPAALLLCAVEMYWPPAADFFQLTPLPVSRWGVVVAVAATGFLLCLGLDRLGSVNPRAACHPRQSVGHDAQRYGGSTEQNHPVR
jgi:magnesium-transporting ATPase (P-type)